MTLHLSRIDSDSTRPALRFGVLYGAVAGIVLTTQAIQDPVASFTESPVGTSVVYLLVIVLSTQIASLVAYAWAEYRLVTPIVVLAALSFEILQPQSSSLGSPYVGNLFALLLALGATTALGVAEYVLRAVTGTYPTVTDR
ncbi:hypothetical protein OB920_20755 [Halobacteria archaeon HArc-gm2]|nr:hypothetical protein [Halobacteria archaeon HArc-gm2]